MKYANKGHKLSKKTTGNPEMSKTNYGRSANVKETESKTYSTKKKG